MKLQESVLPLLLLSPLFLLASSCVEAPCLGIDQVYTPSHVEVLPEEAHEGNLTLEEVFGFKNNVLSCDEEELLADLQVHAWVFPRRCGPSTEYRIQRVRECLLEVEVILEVPLYEETPHSVYALRTCGEEVCGGVVIAYYEPYQKTFDGEEEGRPQR